MYCTKPDDRRAIMNLLRDGIDATVQRHNRIYCLDVLRNISEKGDAILQETCILALGQFAAYVDCAPKILSTSLIRF